jgi:hypothetical protein
VFTKWGISPKCHQKSGENEALKSENLQINGISVVKIFKSVEWKSSHLTSGFLT